MYSSNRINKNACAFTPMGYTTIGDDYTHKPRACAAPRARASVVLRLTGRRDCSQELPLPREAIPDCSSEEASGWCGLLRQGPARTRAVRRHRRCVCRQPPAALLQLCSLTGYEVCAGYLKTQPLDKRKSGFGTRDASRRDEFTNHLAVEQYRERLRVCCGPTSARQHRH